MSVRGRRNRRPAISRLWNPASRPAVVKTSGQESALIPSPPALERSRSNGGNLQTREGPAIQLQSPQPIENRFHSIHTGEHHPLVLCQAQDCLFEFFVFGYRLDGDRGQLHGEAPRSASILLSVLACWVALVTKMRLPKSGWLSNQRMVREAPHDVADDDNRRRVRAASRGAADDVSQGADHRLLFAAGRPL